MVRDREQAERRATRADAAERKRQEQLAHEAGAAAAAAIKAQLDSRVTRLATLLTSVLQAPPRLPFTALKRTAQAPPFSPGDLDRPVPAPQWDNFAPASPGVLSGLFGGKARHARSLEEARSAYEQALAEHLRSEDQRGAELRTIRQEYEQMIRALEAEVRDHNSAVDVLERDFLAGDPDAVEEYFSEVLALSQYPPGFPHAFEVAYRPEPRELVIEYRLPPDDVVPQERDFRYVKTRREIDRLARPAKEVKALYASVVHQIALRTMWECFAVPEAWDVVDAVVFNGIVNATSRATGQAEEIHLVSAPASREDFAGLVLDKLV